MWAQVITTAPLVYGALTENKDDPNRFADAYSMYSKAIAGSPDALCFLRIMSGRYGSSTCGVYGTRSGYATDAAKDYAGKLYDQAVRVLSGSESVGTPLPQKPPTSTDSGSLQNLGSQVKDVGQKVSDAGALLAGEPTSTERTLMLVGVAVLVVILLMRKG